MISPNEYRIFERGCGRTFSATTVRKTEKKEGCRGEMITLMCMF
jgi:hypothetical protein